MGSRKQRLSLTFAVGALLLSFASGRTFAAGPPPIDVNVADKDIGVGYGNITENTNAFDLVVNLMPPENQTIVSSEKHDDDGDIIWQGPTKTTISDSPKREKHTWTGAGVLTNLQHQVRFHGTFTSVVPGGTGPLPQFDVGLVDLDIDVNCTGANTGEHSPPTGSLAEDKKEDEPLAGVMVEKGMIERLDPNNHTLPGTITPAQLATLPYTILRLNCQPKWHQSDSHIGDIAFTGSALDSSCALYDIASGQKVSSLTVPTSGLQKDLAIVTNNSFTAITDITATYTWNSQKTKNQSGAEDVVRVLPVWVDLDVDSDNDGQIAEADDPIEDDANRSGKIVIANRLDRTCNGVPDFADGIDKYGNAGTARTNAFVEMKLVLPDYVNLSTAKLTFTYSAANPDAVTKTSQDINAGVPFDVYDPGSTGYLRIWTKDGVASRKVAEVDAEGDYIAPDKAYVAAKICGDTHTPTLYLEGINSSSSGIARITVKLDPTGNSSAGASVPSDDVRTTVAHIHVIYHSVTGMGVGGMNAPTYPSGQAPWQLLGGIEPDGVACDGIVNDQGVVDEGAILLVRVLCSPVLYDLFSQQKITLYFGYFDHDGNGFSLPPESQGEYRAISSSDTTKLSSNGFENVGQSVGANKVMGAKFYRPPTEYFLTGVPPGEGQRASFNRKVNLGIQLNGSGIEYKGTKPNAIWITRPPVVLVHGINSGPAVWGDQQTGWIAQFNQWGFRSYAADHSGAFNGNGDIHNSYQAVQQMVTDALAGLRTRSAQTQAMRFDVQKVDVTAHSYGGLLTRWYAERTGSQYLRTIRKVITMGTPHRGSPCTNMACEAYRNHLIFNAALNGSLPTTTSVGERLTLLNNQQGTDRVAWHTNGNPPEEGNEQAIVPALQCMSLFSDVLNQLNNTPFRDEIGYAAVVGIDEDMFWYNINLLWHLQPQYPDAGPNDKSYFPWYSFFDGAAHGGDAVVPVWSQTLPALSQQFDLNHGAYIGDNAVRGQVRDWLESPSLPRGAAHRTQFLGAAIPHLQSRQNAYRGAFMAQGSTFSQMGGLQPDAIVRTWFVGPQVNESAEHQFSLHRHGGVVTVHCTGMNDNTARTLTIVNDEQIDDDLHTGINVAASGTAGVLATFHVAEGRIGRDYDADVMGPNGYSDNTTGGRSETWDIGYHMTGPAFGGFGMNSPPRSIEFVQFDVDSPAGPETVPAGGATFTLNGGVEFAPADVTAGFRSTTVYIVYDGFFNTTVATVTANVNAQAGAFRPPASERLLMPYSLTTNLWANGNGHVTGNTASSGVVTGSFFHELEVPGSNYQSGNVTISTQ